AGGSALAHGPPLVRGRSAAVGVSPAAGERYRLQRQPYRGARRQREQRSYHDVTHRCESAADRASRTRTGTTSTRPRPRLGQRVFARRLAPEISPCAQRMGLAVGVSRDLDFRRSAVRRTSTPSPARGCTATSSPHRCAASWYYQTRGLPHAAPFLCHAPP